MDEAVETRTLTVQSPLYPDVLTPPIYENKEVDLCPKCYEKRIAEKPSK